MDWFRLNDLERRVRALEEQQRLSVWPRSFDYAPGSSVSKAEAARMLGFSRASIYHMIEDGRLKTSSDGKRVDVDSINAYMRRYGYEG